MGDNHLVRAMIFKSLLRLPVHRNLSDGVAYSASQSTRKTTDVSTKTEFEDLFVLDHVHSQTSRPNAPCIKL